MENIKPNRHYRIIPVKLKDGKIVRVKELPAFESKNLSKDLNRSISDSTEQTNKAKKNTKTNIDTKTNINVNAQPDIDVKKFEELLLTKYEELLKKLQIGNEMLGTVEENRGQYPNNDPFSNISNSHTRTYMSNTKKVFFPKTAGELAVFKLLDTDLFLTIYNKAPPEKKYLRNNEVKLLINIQKHLKGLYIREAERKIDRLKVREALLEIMLLLVGKAYDNAVKKIAFRRIKREFHDIFNNINDELKFEDKLQFKLPNRYYNFSNLNQLGE